MNKKSKDLKRLKTHETKISSTSELQPKPKKQKSNEHNSKFILKHKYSTSI